MTEQEERIQDTDTFQMIRRKSFMKSFRLRSTQINLMTLIYEFLRDNQDFDYTEFDIRKALNFLPASASVQMALWKLEKIELIKSYRDINNKPAWQVYGWKPDAKA